MPTKVSMVGAGRICKISWILKRLSRCQCNFARTKLSIHQNILAAANDVIKNNRNRREKELWTENIDGEKIVYYRGDTERDETQFIVSQIKKMRKMTEFMVILRYYIGPMLNPV